MMTHHSVMTSSLHIKNFKIDKFGDFSCYIYYNSRTDVFRDVISFTINQCDSRRPKGASGGHEVSASRAAQASEARLCIYIYINNNRVLIVRIYLCNELIEETAGRRKLIFGMWESFGYGSSKF